MTDPISLYKIAHTSDNLTDYEASPVQEFDYSEFESPFKIIDSIYFDRALSGSEMIAMTYYMSKRHDIKMTLLQRFIGWINYNHMNYYKDWK